jgi:glutamate-1-semialdehyde 2,1-aminomutase
MTEIFTREAARDLPARGDELRRRLNKLGAARSMPIEFTGYGSLMAVHFSAKPVRTPRDAAEGHQGLKELFFFDMLERGVYLARRGMLIVSLPAGAAECDRLVEAVEEFLTARAPLLRAKALDAA